MFPPLTFLDFSVPVVFVRSFRQASSKFSSSGVEMRRICNYVKLFLGSPTFQVPTLYSTIYWVHLGAVENHDVLLRRSWLLCLTTTIQRTSSRFSRCVMFGCATMYFVFQPFAYSVALNVP